MGKRGVKADPKDPGLSNRKDGVLCVEMEETVGGQNSMARNPNAPLENVFLPFGVLSGHGQPQRSPSACGQGRLARLCVAQQRGPGQEPHLSARGRSPARPTARGCGHSVPRRKALHGGGRGKLLELLAHL